MPAGLGHGRGPRRPSRFFLTHNAPPQALDRSADDSLPTLTEAMARSVGAARTVDDSISAISEAVSTQKNLVRTAGDTVGAISETVVEDAVDARTVQDTVTPISEAVSRLATLARTTADSVAAITEAVVGVVTPSGPINYTRTAGDSIDAISESVAWPAPSAGVEPAGGVLRYVLTDEPQHFVLSIRDEVEFLVEWIDASYTDSFDADEVAEIELALAEV